MRHGPSYGRRAAAADVGCVTLAPLVEEFGVPGQRVDLAHWSIGTPGSDQRNFSLTTLQSFINYNFGHGLAAGFSSQTTRDGDRPDGQQWTVPVGGTISPVLKIGHQPLSLAGGAFYNVARPPGASEWQLRFQITFLFPE